MEGFTKSGEFTGDIVHLGEGEDFIAFRNLLDEFESSVQTSC